jgi:hypothetical protein
MRESPQLGHFRLVSTKQKQARVLPSLRAEFSPAQEKMLPVFLEISQT